MTKKDTFSLTSRLSGIISSQNPVCDLTAREVKSAKRTYSDEELDALRKMGWLGEDFELFLVISKFLSDNGVFDTASDEYITEIFKNARKFSVSEFYDDAYMRSVKISEVKKGDFLLTTASYERGELFLYDAPDFSKEIIVPKLGFFNGKVTFPTFYEKSMPWMSVCPSEINSMKEQMQAAHGKVLVLGCGLGYYQFIVSGKENVSSVTVVEISETVAEIFKESILPYFPCRDKVKIVVSDAVEFLKSVSVGEYDFVFADIWEGIVDGAVWYEKIRAVEKTLPGTLFTYWIEDQIKFYLESEEE